MAVKGDHVRIAAVDLHPLTEAPRAVGQGGSGHAC